jgi:poly-gamma-glutamate capsule biosynthesis protein CapA/YwtB (metallophosphatase superfamily)
MKRNKLVLIVLFVIMGIFSFVVFEGINNKDDLFFAPRDYREVEINLNDIKDEPVTSLIAVGDISYSRGVERVVKRQGDLYYPFLKIGDYLSTSDILFGNLETTIREGRQILDNEMVFRSNPGTEIILKDVGFSILSLANNHIPDFGQKGVLDTISYLDNVNVEHVGAGENIGEANSAVYIEKNDTIFSFLAYNDSDVVPVSYEASENRAGTAFMRMDNLQDAVKEAKSKSDFVIVSMHSGIEYVYEPNKSQVNFAKAAVDAGADLVIGHHPHVVQTMEKYKGKYIFYSLGNFIFDQAWSEETKEGLIIKIFFQSDDIKRIDFKPVVSEKLAQPRMANEVEANRILNRLQYEINKKEDFNGNLVYYITN